LNLTKYRIFVKMIKAFFLTTALFALQIAAMAQPTKSPERAISLASVTFRSMSFERYGIEADTTTRCSLPLREEYQLATDSRIL
jgi:hypothetical protein